MKKKSKGPRAKPKAKKRRNQIADLHVENAMRMMEARREIEHLRLTRDAALKTADRLQEQLNDWMNWSRTWRMLGAVSHSLEKANSRIECDTNIMDFYEQVFDRFTQRKIEGLRILDRMPTERAGRHLSYGDFERLKEIFR